MNAQERTMLERIKSYPYDLERISKIEDTLALRSYKVTTSYSLSAGGGGGFANSKVEDFAISSIMLKRELEEIKGRVEELEQAIEHAGLSKRERGLIECVMSYGTLSSYARQHGIYYTHVYKIRDGAVRKLLKYIEKNP